MPKPMLPLGDKPLMERIIGQLSEAGIRQVNITTHYLAEKITEHFGDGQAFGVRLTYLPEDKLLGTAGGLGLMPALDTPLLVINGDILTDVDFRDRHARQWVSVTGVPCETFSKNRSAMKPGMRMQPCEAG